MYKHLLIVLSSTACCLSYVNYVIFQGFTTADMQGRDKIDLYTLPTQINETTSTRMITEIEPMEKVQEEASESGLNQDHKEPNATSNETKINKEPSWSLLESLSFSSWRPEPSLSEQLFQEENGTLLTNVSKAALKPSKFKCPEQESPSNIGPYEVPMQRDLVLHIRGTLTKMFNSYHEKALYFLKDISQATKSTKDVEKKCQGNKNLYRKCIKKVSSKCEFIIKNLVTSLEEKRQDVVNFNAEAICNLTEMKENPVRLIKILAMEEASLEFALPGFLRLLHGCSTFYCSKSPINKNSRKPLHHMSDQELVIRFLMR